MQPSPKHMPVPPPDFNSLRDLATTTLAPAGKALLAGIAHANIPFCAYAAIAAVLLFSACSAARRHQHERAHDHTIHGCASLVLAVAHLIG